MIFYITVNSLRNNLSSVLSETGPELTVDLLKDNHRRHKEESVTQGTTEKEPNKL